MTPPSASGEVITRFIRPALIAFSTASAPVLTLQMRGVEAIERALAVAQPFSHVRAQTARPVPRVELLHPLEKCRGARQPRVGRVHAPPRPLILPRARRKPVLDFRIRPASCLTFNT